VFTGRQRILLETNQARDRAEALLEKMLQAERLINPNEQDHVSNHTISRSSMNRAVHSTNKLIASLNTALNMAEADLLDDDMNMLDDLITECSSDRSATVERDHQEMAKINLNHEPADESYQKPSHEPSR